MLAVRLPVSGEHVLVRQPSGAEDLLLAEAAEYDARLTVDLMERIAQASNGVRIDWGMVPLTDLDVLLIRLRQWLVGDTLRTDVLCSSAACGRPTDLSFRLSEYLAHHEPRSLRDVEALGETGWYRATRLGAEFRCPSATDLIAITGAKDPTGVLARRCIRPDSAGARTRRRLERMMESIGPSLYGTLAVLCPHCEVEFSVFFDPQRFILRELSARAASCYEEIHLIAASFHWSEKDILNLPRQRRARYAALAAQARSGA